MFWGLKRPAGVSFLSSASAFVAGAGHKLLVLVLTHLLLSFFNNATHALKAPFGTKPTATISSNANALYTLRTPFGQPCPIHDFHGNGKSYCCDPKTPLI